MLDMATPCLGALLWLGTLPPLKVIVLGLITAFAGYTAVYALNDVVGYRTDREKIDTTGLLGSNHDLDALFIRHPMAHGLLSLKEGAMWVGAWALLALVGSYLLNPVCALIFLMGAFLETVYCLLLRVSHFRTFISGAVKTSGGIAAVFAVAPDPSASFLIGLFLWIFFWEIGGQNVPNDWADVEEDRRLQAMTVPVRFRTEALSILIMGVLALSVLLSIGLFWLTKADIGPIYLAGALFTGFYVLIIPAFRLYKTNSPSEASALFNRASYYPLGMLIVVIVSFLF
jgi:4-hydroxybenzoate polyprenyltransferase